MERYKAKKYSKLDFRIGNNSPSPLKKQLSIKVKKKKKTEPLSRSPQAKRSRFMKRFGTKMSIMNSPVRSQKDRNSSGKKFFGESLMSENAHLNSMGGPLSSKLGSSISNFAKRRKTIRKRTLNDSITKGSPYNIGNEKSFKLLDLL